MDEEKNIAEESTDDQVVICCVNCGRELDEFSGLEASPEWYEQTRFCHYCTDCQESYFDELAEKTTEHLALFYCCVAFNVPFVADCLPSFDEREPWKYYLGNLRRSGQLVDEEGEIRTFFTGNTDILQLFGDKIGTGQFLEKIRGEVEPADKKPGSQRQRRLWGTIDKYKKEEYDELDRLYAIQSKQYEVSGINPELDYNIREICKNLLKYSEYNRQGKSIDAKRMMEIVETIKASNLMRKKDEKPIEDLRIDTLMDKLEKKGMAKNGKLLSYPELIKVLQNDRPHYPHTKDVADQIILNIWNTMQRNAGLPEVSELPDNLKIEPQLGEFEDTPPSWEIEVRHKLGLFMPPAEEKPTEEAEES